jgi:hypothetical protein
MGLRCACAERNGRDPAEHNASVDHDRFSH